MFNKKFFLAGSAMALLAPAAVFAQETSAELRGAISSETGAPVQGAIVTITHVPTGTSRSAVANATGSFFQSGLRPGGPYTISVDANGFESATVDDIFLNPGSQAPLRLTLATASDRVLDTVVVSGVAVSSLSLNNGVGSSYTSEDVANRPSLSRDLVSVVARDPLAISGGANNLSVAGVNPRFNTVTIDGAVQKDNLGLGSNTFATRQSPIDIDIVEAVQLVAADYAVTASSFTGGAVNVVTKSGTNEFDGAAYYYYRDQDYLGEKTFGGEGSFNPGVFEEKEYGVTVSGPIIKDKLFFLVNYSKFETASQVDFTAADAANGVDPAFFTAASTLFQQEFGIDLQGRPQQAAVPEEAERIFARLDWNINDDHRLQLNVQQTEEAGVGGVRATTFQSAWYDTPATLNSYGAQLFSDWSDSLSTRLRVNYTENERLQNCRAGNSVGEIYLSGFNNADVAGSPLDGLLGTRSNNFTAGCDRFRHTNTYADERLQLFGSADYRFDDFIFTFGAEYESIDAANQFSQFSRGRFQFNNAANIIDGIANRVQYRNVKSNNTDEYITEFGYSRVSLFGQARWQVTPNFEAQLGARFESISADDKPDNDPTFLSDVGIPNTSTTDGLDLFMPRASFRWDATDRTQITGGIGLFAGGDPGVWTLNTVAPLVVITSANNVAGANPGQVPQVLLDNVAAGNPVAIDALSPNFELPSDWKASLRVDHSFDLNIGGLNLGDDYQFSAQVIRTESNDAFLWQEYAQLFQAEAQPVGVAPDGRPIYADLQALGISNRTVLANASGDESWVYTFSLANDFDNGLDFFASYTKQQIEAITEGSSSRGISAWRGQLAADRNFPDPRTSIYQVEHAFKLGVGYERDFFGLTSRIDIFNEVTSGRPYTYTFNIDNNNSLFGRAGNGENPYDNSPLYVPFETGDNRVVYASNFDQAAFNDYVDANGMARGRIQPVNKQNSAWNQRWDLRFQQELPGVPGVDRFVGDNNLKLVFDIENFANLLNDDWGTFYNPPSNGQLAVVGSDLVRASDVANLGVDAAPALTGDAARTACTTETDCLYRFRSFSALDDSFRNNAASVWKVRVGIRYEF